MSLRRNMVVARRGAGELVIHNGIALSETEMAQLEALGTPTYLLVPSGFHRLDAPAYKARYPELKVLAPKGSRKKVAEKVAIDGTYEDFPNGGGIELLSLHGVHNAEGAMLVHSNDGTTLVLNDVVMNMDRRRDLFGYLLTTLLGSAPGPRVSRLARWLMVKDGPALRAQLEELAKKDDLVRLIVAHDKVARGPDAREALLKACGYLHAGAGA